MLSFFVFSYYSAQLPNQSKQFGAWNLFVSEIRGFLFFFLSFFFSFSLFFLLKKKKDSILEILTSLNENFNEWLKLKDEYIKLTRFEV
jgi:hypothetical protein